MYISSSTLSGISNVKLDPVSTEPRIHVHLSVGGIISFTLDEWKELADKVAPLVARAEVVRKALAELNDAPVPRPAAPFDDPDIGCGAYSAKCWFCTLPLNHEGDHEARDEENQVCDTWPQEEEASCTSTDPEDQG